VADQPTVSHIANQRLREKYSEIRATGYLAGAMLLYEFERCAWTSFEAEEAGRRSICFLLASVFDGLARRQEGGPVTADYGARLHGILDQPIMESVEIPTGRNETSNWPNAINRLVDAYAQVRALEAAP